MNLRISLAWFPLLLSAASVAAMAAQPGPEAGSKVEKSARLQWDFQPDPALPNVLILGDSISMGYTLGVRSELAGRANVYRPMMADGKKPENCSGTTAGVQKIDEWLSTNRWAVIHFNWGLHDLKHVQKADPAKPSSNPDDPLQADEATYEKNLAAITAKIKATGARLIFATTTPVVPGTVNPLREPETAVRYNSVARKIMDAQGVAINDLHAFCLPHLDKWQLPKNVHFNDAGSQALATQVAKVIRAELDAKPKP